MRDVLKNAEASMVKLCVDLAANLVDQGLTEKLEYVELDARVEIEGAELPDDDVIGLTQFSITEVESKIWQIHFIIGISTVGDKNLFRLRDLSNAVYNAVPAGAVLTYYDADQAKAESWIYVLPGSTQLPTNRVESRPFRFIQVQALLDPYQASQ